MCDEFLSKLDESFLDKEIQSSFPSLRKTMYHIWDAETIWLNRLKRKGNSVLPIKHEGMTFSEFKENFLQTSTEFVDLVSSNDSTYFSPHLTYQNSEGKEFTNSIQDIIHHVMNHSTYHRGQIVTMLRMAGFTDVSSTDFITWCRIQK